MTNKKIIITGTSGFIGSNLYKYLRKDYDIIGIDKAAPNYLDKDDVFYWQDINDPLPDEEDVFAVIHLAAKAGVRGSRENFGQYVKDNILGTKNILDKCADSWKPKKILVASSSSVYSGKSLYSMTKVATEELVNTYKVNGLLGKTEITSLRLFTVYGPGQRKGLAIYNFMENILKDIPITIYGDGTQTRDFTYIGDLCKGISNILKTDELARYYDIGSNRAYSLNEIIHMIAKLTGKVVRIKYEPMNRYDAMSSLSKDTILIDITPIEIGLENQLKWMKGKIGEN